MECWSEVGCMDVKLVEKLGMGIYFREWVDGWATVGAGILFLCLKEDFL
jgi:hypothetical protein